MGNAEGRARKRSMSNPALNRFLRSGGVNNFHVGRGGTEAVARRGDPFPVFAGETYRGRFSMKTEDKGSEAKSNDFAKKENREKGEKRKKDDGESSSDDEDGGPHFKKDGIHKKNSDAGAQSSRKHDFIPVTTLLQTLTCIVFAQTETGRRARARTRRSLASPTRTRMAKLTLLRRSRVHTLGTRLCAWHGVGRCAVFLTITSFS